MAYEKLIRTADRPSGFWGGLMIHKMNIFHTELSLWGLGHLHLFPGAACLDIGCGGGRNVDRLYKKTKGGTVWGLDISPLSVRRSLRHNLLKVLKGRVHIQEGSASTLPVADSSLDVVTAFETIYYWPDLARAFREVYRVLRAGGQFLICNEDAYHEDQPEEHAYIQSILKINFYTDKELVMLLERCGFQHIKVDAHANKRWVSIVATK